MSTNNLKIKGYIGDISVIHEGDDEKQFTSMALYVKEYTGKASNGEARYHETRFDITAFDNVGRMVLSSGLKVGDYIECNGPMRSHRPKEDGPMYWNLILREFDILRRKPASADVAAVPDQKSDETKAPAKRGRRRSTTANKSEAA
jgi:hypothetical protein